MEGHLCCKVISLQHTNLSLQPEKHQCSAWLKHKDGLFCLQESCRLGQMRGTGAAPAAGRCGWGTSLLVPSCYQSMGIHWPAAWLMVEAFNKLMHTETRITAAVLSLANRVHGQLPSFCLRVL